METKCFLFEEPILNGKVRVLATCDDKMTLPSQEVKKNTLAGCIPRHPNVATCAVPIRSLKSEHP